MKHKKESDINYFYLFIYFYRCGYKYGYITDTKVNNHTHKKNGDSPNIVKIIFEIN